MNKICHRFIKHLYGFLTCVACLQISSALAITKEEGMGGVGTAYPQSSTGFNFNPAIITELEDRYDTDMSLTYQRGKERIRGSLIPLINQKSGTQCKYFPLFVGGICQKLTSNLTVAASIDGRRISKYALDRPFQAIGQGRQGIETIIGIITPGAAYKINSCHSIGIGVPIAIGRIKINGFQNGKILSLFPNNYTNRGYDWAYGVGIRLGWFWRIHPKLSFGISYNSRLLTASHFHKYKGFIPLKGKLELPNEFRVGFAYQWHERSTISFDVQYNIFKPEKTLSNSPLNPAPFGSTHGPGLGWKNQVVFRAGADARLTDKLTIRAGFLTFSPFIRPFNTIINFALPLYTVKTFVTAGATWQLNCNTELNIAYLYGAHRFVRGKRLPLPLFNGHLDIDYENHNLFLGIGKTF
jgi:long-chain fatty acid transport protein